MRFVFSVEVSRRPKVALKPYGVGTLPPATAYPKTPGKIERQAMSMVKTPVKKIQVRKG